MEVRGRGEVVSGNTEFYTFSSCKEAAVACSHRILWSTTSDFINFFFKLLIHFYMVNLAGPC